MNEGFVVNTKEDEEELDSIWNMQGHWSRPLRKITEKKSVFRISMFGYTGIYENTSGMDAYGLYMAYLKCDKPFADMAQYGIPIYEEEYAYITQEWHDFSIEFEPEERRAIIGIGEDYYLLPIPGCFGQLCMDDIRLCMDDIQELSRKAGIRFFFKIFNVLLRSLSLTDYAWKKWKR